MSYYSRRGDDFKYLQRKHGLSPADIKLKDAGAASNPRLMGTERLLKAKRQLSRNALALAQVRCIGVVDDMILKLPQKKRPIIANANKIKRRKAARAAGHQSRQYRASRYSNVKIDRNLTPTAARNVETSTLYIIKASPGKGLGMFATREIRKGTRILAEKPFFTLSDRPELSVSDPYAPNDISEAFERLPASEQRKYFSLHCPDRPDCSPGVSIYEANCFEMGSGTCICLDASRINHSCIANAHYSWNDSIKRETVHAVKDISKDEEITISYCSAILSFEERRRELESYVFNCSCPACKTGTEFGMRSQIRRLEMVDLDQEIADYQNDPLAAREEYGQYDEMSAIRRLVKLMDKEGLVYQKSLAYHDAAECALKRGSREKALEYASKELDVDLCCVGRDSPDYDETIAFFLRVYFGAEEILD